MVNKEYDDVDAKNEDEYQIVRYGLAHTIQRGVAILIKQCVNFEIEKCCTDKEGPYILVVGKIGGMDLSLGNLYYPPDMGPELITH